MSAALVLTALLGVAVLIFLVDLMVNSKPLSWKDINTLAEIRRRKHALRTYRFSRNSHDANVDEKKSMKPKGEFRDCNYHFWDAAPWIAGLLKYKKHEWIVVAFVRDLKIHRVWWNKGPNRESVSLGITDFLLDQAICEMQPDAIAIFHNHPNSNPQKYRVNVASHQDLKSADFFATEFGSRGISLLEFICERGEAHLYYASFSESFMPVEDFVRPIAAENGSGIWRTYCLRKELQWNRPPLNHVV